MPVQRLVLDIFLETCYNSHANQETGIFFHVLKHPTTPDKSFSGVFNRNLQYIFVMFYPQHDTCARYVPLVFRVLTI